MHKVLREFPFSFDGVNIAMLAVGEEHDFGAIAVGLKQAGYIGDIASSADTKPADTDTVDPSKDAEGEGEDEGNPETEAGNENSEEDEAKVAADKEAAEALEAELAAELTKHTVAQLHEIAKAESVKVESDDNKPDLVAKIAKARLATK